MASLKSQLLFKYFDKLQRSIKFERRSIVMKIWSTLVPLSVRRKNSYDILLELASKLKASTFDPYKPLFPTVFFPHTMGGKANVLFRYDILQILRHFSFEIQ